MRRGVAWVRERQRLHNKLFTPPLALFYTLLLSINAAWQDPQRALQFTVTHKQLLIIQYKGLFRSSASQTHAPQRSHVQMLMKVNCSNSKQTHSETHTHVDTHSEPDRTVGAPKTHTHMGV